MTVGARSGAASTRRKVTSGPPKSVGVLLGLPAWVVHVSLQTPARRVGVTLTDEETLMDFDTVEPTTRVDEAMRPMTEKRHRHLPVRDRGQVHGMVSMGDVMRWVIRSQQEQFDGAMGAVERMGMASRRS